MLHLPPTEVHLMASKVPQSAVRAQSSVASVLSVLLGILALTLAVIVVFNGSGRQAQYEANRQLCIDGLSRFGRTILDIRYSEGKLTSGQLADFVVDGGAARVGCFETEILDPKSEFHSEWSTAEELLQLPVGFKGSANSPQVVKRMTNPALDQMASALNDALTVAVTTPGPDVWPWSQPVPTAPATFPPYVDDAK